MTIRRLVEDFIVEESLTPQAAGQVRATPAAYALYQLRKERLNTPDALAHLARALRLRPADLAFVGLKDRHAVTTQYVTAPRRDGPPELADRSWSARRIGWLERPLTAEMVAGNRFRIVVRGLTPEQSRRMDDHATRLCADRAQAADGPARARALLIANYFGDQRFGSARHFQGFAAWHLVHGDFEAALRLTIATPSRKDQARVKEFRTRLAAGWGDFSRVLPALPRCPDRRAVEHLARHPEDFRGAFTALPYFTQQMAVYSYQSHLWNRIAGRLIRQRLRAADTIVVDDPFGELAFPSAAAVEADLRDLDLPVPGRNTELVEPWKEAALAVLREERIESLRDLRLPGVHRPFFGEAPRQLLVRAEDFALGAPQRDGSDRRGGRLQRQVSFALPRGGYATVVLRALGQ